MSNLNLHSVSLKTLPFVLSLQSLVKSLSPCPLYILKSHSKVSPEPFLPLAEQAQVAWPFLLGEVFQPSDPFCGLLWPCTNRSMSVLCRGLQSWTQDSRWGLTRAEQRGQNPLPRPTGHAAFDAAQGTLGFAGCKCTLPPHVQFYNHQYPQILCRAVLNQIITYFVLILGNTLTQVQDFALGLLECSHASISVTALFITFDKHQ